MSTTDKPYGLDPEQRAAMSGHLIAYEYRSFAPGRLPRFSMSIRQPFTTQPYNAMTVWCA